MTSEYKYKFIYYIVLVVFFIIVSGCARNIATGERQLVILSSEEENNIGAREHPNIIKSFGGIYDNQELREYVSNLGNKIALNSEMPDIRWTFTVLDNPLVNAFALPGGYIYVTRGLLSLANDESEIASVLGHEIAHVTARHTAQRHAKSTLSNVGLDILNIVVGQPIITNATNIGLQGVLSAFSRSEELEADKLGIRYIIKSKYDPYGSYRFLNRLNELTKISSKNDGDIIRSIFATHPKTTDRMKASKAYINNSSADIINRDVFLNAIDGMIYGNNSQHGIVKNNNFYHLELNFSFNTPKNYKIKNNNNNVITFNKNKEVIVIFDGLLNKEKLSLLEIAESNYLRSNITAYEEVIIDNKNAILFKENKLIKYEGTQYNRKTYLIDWTNDRVWRFSILLKPQSKTDYEIQADKIARSIHELSEEERILGRPKFISIYKTKKGDTASKLANQMAVEKNKLKILQIMNGLNMDSEEILPEGTLLKIIVN